MSVMIFVIGGLPSYGLVLLLIIPILKHVQIENKTGYNNNSSQSALVSAITNQYDIRNKKPTDDLMLDNNITHINTIPTINTTSNTSTTSSPQRPRNTNTSNNNNSTSTAMSSNNNEYPGLPSPLSQSSHLKSATSTKHLKVNTSNNMNMTTSNMQYSPRSRTSSCASNNILPDNNNNYNNSTINSDSVTPTERYTPTNNVVSSPYALPSPTQLSQQLQLQLQLSSYMNAHPSPNSNHSPIITPTAYKNNNNPLRKTPPGDRRPALAPGHPGRGTR